MPTVSESETEHCGSAEGEDIEDSERCEEYPQACVEAKDDTVESENETDIDVDVDDKVKDPDFNLQEFGSLTDTDDSDEEYVEDELEKNLL